MNTIQEAKGYIVYILACVLNELKEVPAMRMRQYLDNPDRLLDKVVALGKNRDWVLDRHSALGLCVYIVEYYLDKDAEERFNRPEKTALEQIIGNFSNDVLKKITDPVWERYYDNLIFEHSDDEDVVYQYHDVPTLERAVRSRECLPAGYMRM